MAFRALLTLVVTAAIAGLSLAGDPSYFRRNSGVSRADAQPLPADFSKANTVWRTPLLPGNSTPCVAGDAIFLTNWDKAKKQLATVALDRDTGKLRWKRRCPAKRIEPFHPVGSPASSSCACDGERVYAFFGSYGMLCYDLEGNLKWKKPMGPFQDEFGASSSPVPADGKVFLNEDHDTDSFVVALDAKTGKQLWRTPRPGQTRSYASPVIWNVKGNKQLVCAGALKLTAYDLDTGKPIWWVRGLSRIVDVTPAIAGDTLYIATWTPGGDRSNRISMGPFADALKQFDKNGDGQVAKSELKPGAVLSRFFRIDLNLDGQLDKKEWDAHARVFELAQNVAIAVRAGGKGDVTESHVRWTHRRSLPTVPSPLVYRGVMYLIKDGGIITALNAKTGKPVKQARAKGRGNYYASPVAGDGNVYVSSERGVVTILKAGGPKSGFKIAGSHNFGERIMATPVIAGGRIYLRTDKALYCFAKNRLSSGIR
ncbi:MAG: PQQ-binding-like beta-propeller repeat protein [Planctomycetaceae bacterium]